MEAQDNIRAMWIAREEVYIATGALPIAEPAAKKLAEIARRQNFNRQSPQPEFARGAWVDVTPASLPKPYGLGVTTTGVETTLFTYVNGSRC